MPRAIAGVFAWGLAFHFALHFPKLDQLREALYAPKRTCGLLNLPRGIYLLCSTMRCRLRPGATFLFSKASQFSEASNPQPLFKAASLDRAASKACRDGKLRRFGGGVAEFGGRLYPAATLTDISRQAGIELEPGIYIFVSEGSTGCQVYFFEE